MSPGNPAAPGSPGRYASHVALLSGAGTGGLADYAGLLYADLPWIHPIRAAIAVARAGFDCASVFGAEGTGR